MDLPGARISIEKRIEQLLARLSETEACGFEDLFEDAHTRQDLIVTFLALLEMIRTRVVRVFQAGMWEKDSRVISKAEAREVEIEMDRLGLVHALYDAGVDVDGKPPIVVCHCLETDCIPTRMRAHFGIINAHRKGENVAVIDRQKCAEGCTKMPVCLPRCPFGAMRYSPLSEIASINISRCFGCGLCRPVCPTKAIKLVDRMTFPALVDVW